MDRISSTYKDGESYKKFCQIDRAFVYVPERQWLYSHHASITVFNGAFFAVWSNGRFNEDDAGQRVLISSSADGLQWSAPHPLVDSLPGKHSELVLTAAGFHQTENTLVAYIGSYEYKPDHLNNGVRKVGDSGHQDTDLLAVTSTDGHTWSSPQSLGLPIIPNHGPQALSSGRLLISGNISFPYSDDPTGLSGWTMSGIYPASMQRSICDDSESFWEIRKKQGWSSELCEGSFFQTDDQTVHMLLRSGEPRLWCSSSKDQGVSWSSPEPTAFPDNGSKFHFGRLPDGRFYYVGTPSPKPWGARTPLILSVSDDGQVFDRHWILGDDNYVRCQDGMHKGGQFGYPHTLIHDGVLFVIFSRMKEAIQVLRIPLSELD
jgi:hypothetical protein